MISNSSLSDSTFVELPTGNYSLFVTFVECSAGNYATVSSCLPCPANSNSTEPTTECPCFEGFYRNPSEGPGGDCARKLIQVHVVCLQEPEPQCIRRVVINLFLPHYEIIIKTSSALLVQSSFYHQCFDTKQCNGFSNSLLCVAC